MDALHREKLHVRGATPRDIPAIINLMRRAYPDIPIYTPGNLQGQISNYPEGQFVAEARGEIVGYAATFRIDEGTALSSHTWAEITGAGYASRHDANGEWLYAMEVCVDPAWRGRRVGQRLYEARKRLAENLDLKGIVFGGRLPGLARKLKLAIRSPRFKWAMDLSPSGFLKIIFQATRTALATHRTWCGAILMLKPHPKQRRARSAPKIGYASRPCSFNNAPSATSMNLCAT